MTWNGVQSARLAPLVVQTYGAVCYLCGGGIDLAAPRRSPMGLSLDHVRPRSLGGSDEIDNLRPVHFRCNLKKGNRPAARPTRMNSVAAGFPGLSP